MVSDGVRMFQGKNMQETQEEEQCFYSFPFTCLVYGKKTQTIACNLRLKLENLRHPGHPSLFEVPVQHVDENHQPKNNARTII
jgi:hypothetical protein